jgi:hypothetical protein
MSPQEAWLTAAFVIGSGVLSALITYWILRPSWECHRCPRVMRAWTWRAVAEMDRAHSLWHWEDETKAIWAKHGFEVTPEGGLRPVPGAKTPWTKEWLDEQRRASKRRQIGELYGAPAADEGSAPNVEH